MARPRMRIRSRWRRQARPCDQRKHLCENAEIVASVTRLFGALAVAVSCGAVGIAGCSSAARPSQQKLVLTPCRVADVQEELRCGTYQVFENRQTRRGRTLPLKIVVVPARIQPAKEAPIFFLAGGPGETNTDFAKDFVASTHREGHDVVFVDSRGTGEGHRLTCRLPRSDDHLEGYLQTPFAPEIAAACRHELEPRFDLSQYSTAAMVEDLDDVRQSLGYDQINLEGGSFGTYAALMYIRAHRDHVRSAYLASLVTFDNRVPLYHANAAQWSLDQLFQQCEMDAACSRAYPTLREDFAAVLARLHTSPVRTTVRHPVTGAPTEIALTEKAFADAVRVMMYSGARGRELPFLILQAKAGRFDLLAETAVDANRGFYRDAPMGLYYAVTCTEFVNRIQPEEVEPATRGSYAGAWRVRDQMASCQEWPKTVLPASYFKPFTSDVPALLISGNTDPVSPPQWGEEVHAFLANSIHLVVPGGHVPLSPCTNSIAEAMFHTGSTKSLDLGCVADLRPAPFKLP
jgi:pimeloyl-ACP methyl ester carboxylesterase